MRWEIEIMATIIKGKHKGKQVEIRQFCNDWFHVSHPDLTNQESIIKPFNLVFTDDEAERIRKAESDGKTGSMFNFYYWDTFNTIKKV